MESPNPPIIIEKEKKENLFWETLKFVVVALIIVIPIRMFVAQPFVVQGTSMDPTFASNNYLIVNQLSYRLGNPERGQVVIFKFPLNESEYFIKRIIGLPGETVKIDGTTVTIINKANPNGFKLDEPYVVQRNQIEGSTTVQLEDDQYFMMGDNRKASYDSRVWGPVKRDLIIGTPILRLYPLNTISIAPGDFKEAQ